MQAVEIHLPGGFQVGEQWHRSAWLRPVTGREEEFLLQEGKAIPPAACATQLITRCLQRLGPVEPVGAELVRELNVGDREALLLHLRRLTLGGLISCLLCCPQCESKMDLDFQVEEVLLPGYPNRQRAHKTNLREGERSYRVVFRVPNGEDQEIAAIAARDSVDVAAEIVLRRCVESVTSEDGELVTDLLPVLIRDLPEKMAALDPQAEILFDLTCPECGAKFTVPFDAADYICRELAAGEHEFYREVHSLCFHYHWQEDAVLGLSRRKRRIYLELLADELAGRGPS